MKNEGKIVAALAIGLILLVVIGILAARQMPTVDQVNGTNPWKPMPPVEERPDVEGEEPEEQGSLTQASCTDAGGTWNECGSACRGAAPGTACILMCVTYCECTSDAQCPSGTTCGDFVEGVGVCQ